MSNSKSVLTASCWGRSRSAGEESTGCPSSLIHARRPGSSSPPGWREPHRKTRTRTTWGRAKWHAHKPRWDLPSLRETGEDPSALLKDPRHVPAVMHGIVSVRGHDVEQFHRTTL